VREHVDLGDVASVPPRPASVAVWRSVRAGGDTKTRTSRRTLALPHLAVTALQALHAQSAPEPRELVFCTATGQPLDAANVRRFFRAVCTTAGIGPGWTPREPRHTLVRLMSDSDVAVDEIARLIGHASSKVTETVYRHRLRPVLTTGAAKMDVLLGAVG
jgi:integrase